MEANLHAAGLIGVAVFTLALLLRAPRPPVGVRNVLRNLAISVAILFVGAGVLTVHWCREGGSFYQWLIPCAGGFLILTFVSLPFLRRAGAALVFLTAFVLSLHYETLIHTERYTGSPENARRISAMEVRRARERAREVLLVLAAEGNDHYSAGPLAEMDLLKGAAGIVKRLTVRQVTTVPFWHTPLTGLYAERRAEMEVWYPGGPLRDAAARLEIRPWTQPRPESPARYTPRG